MTDLRGRGAWTTVGKDNGSRYYCLLEDKPLDGSGWFMDLSHLAVNYGVKAIQVRLDSLGFRGRSGGRLTVDGYFGQKTKRAVKWFQTENGLVPDGVVGSTVAAALWRPLVYTYGVEHSGRPELLWGQTVLESALDPGAVSSVYGEENGPDFGLCQINLHFNPQVSIDSAFSPPIALAWSSRHLADALNAYSGKGERLQTQCAVAHHNSPVRAAEWYRTGRPPTAQIGEYVSLVLGRAAGFVPPDE